MADTDDYKAFGERLRALRLKARLTQAKLAEHAEISCVYVNKLERGLAVPSLQVLNRLARCLNTDAAGLLAGAGANGAGGGAAQQPSPYLQLYLSGTKRDARNLVFNTADTPMPPLPGAKPKPEE